MPVRATLVYLGDKIAAINKPAGLSLATSQRDEEGAVTRLLAALSNSDRAKMLQGWSLVHRLDSGTSGLTLLARGPLARKELSALFSSGAVHRRYLALVWGEPHSAVGRLAWALGPDPSDRRKMRVDPAGKNAATRYRVLASTPVASLLELVPETGRTHQIRVHLAEAGHSILGDDFYGRLRHIPMGINAKERAALQPGRPLLHAWKLDLPETKISPPLSLEAPLPEDFKRVLKKLRIAFSEGQESRPTP